jgi:tetratricopeptide (TPR) repeat protein
LQELGVYHLYLLEFNNALPVLKECVRLDPGNSAGYVYLSQVQSALDMHEESVASAREAIRVGPNDYSGYVCLANTLSTTKDPRKRDLPAALAAVKQAVTLNPEDETYRVMFMMGLIYNNMENWAESARAMESVIQRWPKNHAQAHPVDALFLLAIARHHLKKPDLARAGYDRAMKVLPGVTHFPDTERYQAEAARLLGIPQEKPPK